MIDISKEGLILNLDATQYNSYSGSGTTWTDLGPNSTNATLNNTPTYLTNNSGAISFDGTNDYANVTMSGVGSTITIEMYCRINSSYANKYLFNFGTSSALYSVNFQFGFGFGTNANDCYGVSSTVVSNTLWREWKHIVLVMRSDVSYTNNKMYFDGVAQTLSQLAGTETTGNRTFNSGGLQFCGTQFSAMPIDMSVFRVYNRELSVHEINHNLNVIRTRANLYRYDIQPIVRHGLSLSLDAGINDSYRSLGSSTFDKEWWRNLSYPNRFSMINSPTYVDTEGGYLDFNGSTQYMDFTDPGVGTTMTVEMWATLGESISSKILFGWNQYYVGANSSGHFGFSTNNSGDIYGISSGTVTSLGMLSNWKHYVFEMRSDVSYSNNKMYVNAASQTLSQQTGTETSGNRTFNSGNGRISGYRLGSDSALRMPFGLAIFRIYDRALSQAEITSNYDQYKARFGL